MKNIAVYLIFGISLIALVWFVYYLYKKQKEKAVEVNLSTFESLSPAQRIAQFGTDDARAYAKTLKA